MTDIERLRAWHKAHVGITEYPPNSNNVIFNTHYYGSPVSGEPYKWCVVYQWDAFRETGLAHLFYDGKKANSCRVLRDWAKKCGRWVTEDFRPGDLALLDFSGKRGDPTHIAWLDRVNGSIFWSYEGNTSATSDDNGGAVMYRTRQVKLITGAIRPRYRENDMAKYHRQDGVDIVEVPADQLRIVMTDHAKKAAPAASYVNGGFFASYIENKEPFTLPVAHLAADYEATSVYTNFYTGQRAKLRSLKRVVMDSSDYKTGNEAFYGKAISTLLLQNGMAEISEVTTLPDKIQYAVSGVPVMRSGEDVIFNTFVKRQGWEAGNVRATWHVFIGLKENPARTVYIMGWKTTKSNMIKSAEAYKRFRAMGFRDVIKLDGGGSYVFSVNGRPVSSTSENRRINSILCWGDTEETGNPHAVPTTTLRKGTKGEGVMWLQWQLTSLGYDCGTIDGDFGSKTLAAVKAYQKSHGLTVDGIVGPVTRQSLTS